MWGWSVAAVAVVRVDGCAALPAGEKTEKAFDGRLSRTAVATGRLPWEREENGRSGVRQREKERNLPKKKVPLKNVRPECQRSRRNE